MTSEEIAKIPISEDNKEVLIKKVTPNLKWEKIEHEKYRCYVFPNTKIPVIIQKPVLINVSTNGHRIVDIKNVAHYIPFGWIHLFWETDDGVIFRF